MNNSDMPAMPLPNSDIGLGGPDLGLTKREHFAGLAMQGLVTADKGFRGTPEEKAALAVMIADALLAELEKGNE